MISRRVEVISIALAIAMLSFSTPFAFTTGGG